MSKKKGGNKKGETVHRALSRPHHDWSDHNASSFFSPPPLFKLLTTLITQHTVRFGPSFFFFYLSSPFFDHIKENSQRQLAVNRCNGGADGTGTKKKPTVGGMRERGT